MQNAVIELIVRNHPGVMSHITGLFSRRGFNLESIVCAPTGDGSQSRMYLLLNKENRLEQIIKQLKKLYDVFEVSLREEGDYKPFNWLYTYDHCQKQTQNQMGQG